MKIRKPEPTWRRTALFTATLGISILLSGQVGHADQTTAATPAQQLVAQPAATQDNGTAQQAATVAAGQENPAPVTTQHQYGTADQPIEIVSGNLNEPKASAIKQQMHEVAVENGKEVSALSSGLDKSEVVGQQATDKHGELYADYLNNPQNWIGEDAPADLREQFDKLYSQKQELLKKMDACQQAIKQQQPVVNEKKKISDEKQQIADKWKEIIQDKKKSGKVSLEDELECQEKVNDWSTKNNEYLDELLKLSALKNELTSLTLSRSDLSQKISSLIEKKDYMPYVNKMIEARPEVANLRKEAQRLQDEAFDHYDRAKALKTKYGELQVELKKYSAEIYKVQKTVTRTIHVNIPGRADSNITQKVQVLGEEVRNNGQVTYKNWQPASWPKYTPAAYFGYTCDVNEIPAVALDEKTPNQTVMITYTAQAGLDNNYDHNDHGNYGWLDHYQLSGNQLQVSGWHATSDVKNKPYHYLIVFNNTTHSEVTRLMVSQTARPDIAVVHNVYGAGLAGFQTNLDLPAAVLQAGDSLSLISRYTDDQAGNGNATDYWFNLEMDQGNHGYLDVAQVQNGKLHVAGWHATNQVLGRNHHVLILFDASRSHEIARVNATNAERPDIAKIYPTVGNAALAGFVGDFDLAPELATDNLQIISRYSSDANANSDYVDYWSTPRRLTTDTSNQGWLDDVSVRDGQLHIAGWHATNLALGRRYHTIIVLNANTGHEIARQTTDQLIERDDLVWAFPNILTAQQSGINMTMQLTPEMVAQPIRIISRYSSTADANNDYVDYWFNPQSLVKDTGNYGNLEGFGARDGKIYASGWHATDRSLGRKYHYIIVFDATPGIGRELSRFNITDQEVSRPDVARAFPNVITAGNSGFNISFGNDPSFMEGHDLQIVSRWTDDPAGNGNPVDYWFKPVLIHQTFSKEHLI